MEAVLTSWKAEMPTQSVGRRAWQKVTTLKAGISWGDVEFFQSSTEALPGVVITSEVAATEDKRRIIQGMFVQFAAAQEISKATQQAAATVLSSLPAEAQLPKVAVDDGGVLMTWAVEGNGRTLLMVVDNVLHAVANSGTPEAIHLADIPFDGILPTEILSAIPR
ncbi:hypothetical protein [Paucibacter sp. M5-1]|uniref:hypothetical protein n=1 Tax=Paucibacter sp. M5-1 TaxID=3015998 RepID=UPI0022B8C570|nr:hypothetical protein [Paucibacter sp. M5-1]MCZ7881858.1 hypothetical protein [Paucibacter sp. M5-1]